MPQPVDMVLFCPKCGMQHIDAPESHRVMVEGVHVDDAVLWDNPPHRSHLCHGCGHIWRPADVATNGVAAVKTKGSKDSPLATPPTPASEVAQDAARVTVSIDTLWKAWSALEALWGHTKNNYQIAGPNWCAQRAIQDLRSVLQGAGVDVAALTQGERHGD
jgi:hypothetical protein